MRSCLLAGEQGRVEDSGEPPAGCKAREVMITCPLAGGCASAGVLLEDLPLAGVPVAGVPVAGMPLAGVPLAVWPM